MDVDGLPIIGPGVDYTEVGAIHQKRTLAFINHFIATTVSFMNKFARSCEQRLEKFDARIQKIDASLSILEAKLSSISGLESVCVAPVEEKKYPLAEVDTTDLEEPTKLDEPKPEHLTTSKFQDPQYARFMKMVHVGVPIQAVRLKMQAEGLDPSVLDDPDSAATVPVPHDRSSQSDLSFSD